MTTSDRQLEIRRCVQARIVAAQALRIEAMNRQGRTLIQDRP